MNERSTGEEDERGRDDERKQEGSIKGRRKDAVEGGAWRLRRWWW